MTTDTAVQITRDAVLHIVRDPVTAHLVQVYYDPGSTFAGFTFDLVGANPPDRFTTDDILAVSLLDTPLGPRAVRDLLQVRGEDFRRLLAVLPGPDVALWEASDDQLDSVEALWLSLRSINGIGPTRAGKVLARKRPALVPIADKVTVALFDAPSGYLWATLRAVLSDEEVRGAIEALCGDLPATVTTLRLLDTAVWMTGSRSKSVRAARAWAVDAGLS